MRSREWLKGTLFGFGFTAMLGIGAGAFAAHQQESKQVAVDKDVMSHGIDEALAELAQIEKINSRSRDSKVRLRLQSRISDLRADLEAIDSHLDAASPVRERDWDRDPDRDRDQVRDRWYDNDDYDELGRDNHVSYTISDSEIDTIVIAVQGAFSSSSKLALIREGISGRWITVVQLARLMDELAYSSDRVDCAATLHANLSDPQNFYQIYSHLPFDADRDTLRARVSVH
jgi:hypothetical protein